MFIQARKEHVSFPGWTGDFCNIDQNGCIDPGCPIGTNCTDVPAPGVGANCSDCPIGSEVDGAKCNGNASCLFSSVSLVFVCEDIDECGENDDNCDQVCINEVPFFRCDCEKGFRLANQTECIGILLGLVSGKRL